MLVAFLLPSFSFYFSSAYFLVDCKPSEIRFSFFLPLSVSYIIYSSVSPGTSIGVITFWSVLFLNRARTHCSVSSCGQAHRVEEKLILLWFSGEAAHRQGHFIFWFLHGSRHIMLRSHINLLHYMYWLIFKSIIVYLCGSIFTSCITFLIWLYVSSLLVCVFKVYVSLFPHLWLIYTIAIFRQSFNESADMGH